MSDVLWSLSPKTTWPRFTGVNEESVEEQNPILVMRKMHPKFWWKFMQSPFKSFHLKWLLHVHHSEKEENNTYAMSRLLEKISIFNQWFRKWLFRLESTRAQQGLPPHSFIASDSLSSFNCCYIATPLVSLIITKIKQYYRFQIYAKHIKERKVM